MKNLKKVLLLAAICLPALAGCSKNSIDDKTIVVGATIKPHAQILKQAKQFIKDKGYTLKIKEFTDYQQLNPALQDGSLDANFFQHLPYLEDFNANNHTDLVGVFNVHFEPLSLYKGKSNDNIIASGSKIAIPNDSSNGARALLLLAENHLITLDSTKGLNVTVLDITDKKGLTIVELPANLLPSNLKDVDYAIINGNYALSADIPNEKIILSELADSQAAVRYANIIAVKNQNKDKEAINILVEALNRSQIRDFILNNYDNKVLPVF